MDGHGKPPSSLSRGLLVRLSLSLGQAGRTPRLLFQDGRAKGSAAADMTLCEWRRYSYPALPAEGRSSKALHYLGHARLSLVDPYVSGTWTPERSRVARAGPGGQRAPAEQNSAPAGKPLEVSCTRIHPFSSFPRGCMVAATGVRMRRV